jgi:hypothetical protein
LNQMRSRMRLLVLAVSTILLATLLAHGALALAPGNFEGNDGNLVVDTAGNTDWINAPHRSAQNDLPTGTTDNSFGQGTKESNVAVHVGLGSIPNSKADLARFATAYETIGTNTFLYPSGPAGPDHRRGQDARSHCRRRPDPVRLPGRRSAPDHLDLALGRCWLVHASRAPAGAGRG